ncbi:restriction endonuclease subunit R [bacterium]|nr:restriction endonuclease subunit R [bacterium]
MIIQANFDEAKQSQLPAVELLINMGYKYLSPAEVDAQRRNDHSKFILQDIAFNKLLKINWYHQMGINYRFSEKNIHTTIQELENIPLEGLMDTSRDVYHTLMSSSGKTIREFIEGKFESFDFKFIDFENIENNDFHVTVEFTAEGRQKIRPDIVLFVNGIPFAIIENKKSGTKVEEALVQMNRNQGPEYCPKLFVYPQILIGTNKTELLYGTTGTPNKFYARWKEKENPKFDKKINNLISKPIENSLYTQICADLNGATLNHKQIIDRMPTEQDKGIVALLEPKRILDLAKNFILYDAGIKKISRYQQYFAIHKSLKTIETEKEGITGLKRNGGLIWHTQGSGKSLTMVMFVKALIEDERIQNPRIIIVTDRKQLHKQISDTFRDCKLKKGVVEATSGQDLLRLIKEKNLNVITTLVHKFESAKNHRAGFMDDSKNIFVLIDEAHRGHGGMANAEMNRTIPNACYIGFTGTPLMKKEKESWRKFGGYIDKYTIDDALSDCVILPLIYEGRYVELIQNKEQIDRQVDRITKELNQEQKKELQKFVDKRVIRNNPQRIAEIAYDIQEHYIKNFQGTGLKAQIVAPSKYSAILFQRFFEEYGNKVNTAVIISETSTDEEEKDTHKKEVSDFLKSIRHNFRDLVSYEKQKIDSFKKSEDGVEILIVVDKLLTGFDAPRNTVLYLAKDLKDHNLLQAIARVNRIYENKKSPKTSGFIIDYSENAKNIDTAMKLFGNYDEEDVKSTLIDVIAKRTELESGYDALHEMFKELKNSKDDEAYIQKLSDEQERSLFYKALNNFIRLFNENLALQDFSTTFPHLDTYKFDLKKFLELRKTVRLKYADTDDFSEYKLQLVKILDQYIDAKEVEVMTKQININDTEAFSEAIAGLGSDKSKAEAIAAQVQRTITEETEKDPEFYNRFSEKISKLLQKLREGKIADLEALNEIKALKTQVLEKEDEEIPAEIKEKSGADIFYRNLKDILLRYKVDEAIIVDIILDIFKILEAETIVDWHKNNEVKRVITNKLDDYLYDIVKIEKGVILSNEDLQDILLIIMDLACNNHEIFKA